MYIHIGGDYSIPEKTILGIFDFDSITNEGSYTNEFLKQAQERNRIEYISYDIPRSIILAIDRVYISSVSTRTIRNRIYGIIQKDI